MSTGGSIIALISVGMLFLSQYLISNLLGDYSHLAGIGIAIIFYFITIFSYIFTVNKRIKNGEIK
jgi:hypothetical protein